ncbi:hypothetical protein J4734_18865 [Klebsiella pneumoniae]|uniref:Uncharacterized protein n=1 Tax=Klebsiella pneumoniae TaxID=573 RepID=A0A939SSK1_KLEPN|nr:hypothetical protein [Klebsiella pneumoniae]
MKKVTFTTTQDKIINFCDQFKIDPNVFVPWEEILIKVEKIDGDKHGTALFIGAWTRFVIIKPMQGI